MSLSLDNFILGFPVLFLKQYPYAWIPLIALWESPFAVGLFLPVIVIGILSLRWRSAAWVSAMRREHGDDPFYVERLPIPIQKTAQNAALLLAVCGLTAWLIQGQFGLDFWQYFILLTAFLLTYTDGRIFGAVTIYVVTGTGIAIYFVPGHLDYRIFIRFKEMRQVARLENVEKISDSWTVCSRFRKVSRGALLVPRSPTGFSRRLNEILLTPVNTDEFLKRIPSTLVTDGL